MNVAVSERFELSIRCRIHTFQACSFSHSDNSPNQILVGIVNQRGANLMIMCLMVKAKHEKKRPFAFVCSLSS